MSYFRQNQTRTKIMQIRLFDKYDILRIKKIQKSFMSSISDYKIFVATPAIGILYVINGFLSGLMKFRDEQKKIRPEKVDEIKSVWQSYKLKTHNQRLIYLMRHCTIIEPQYGYLKREFAHAIHPQKMDPKSTGQYDYEYYAFKSIRQMFRRFSKDVENHQVFLAPVLAKGTGKWYYYNIIDNDQAIKDHQYRQDRISLGIERAIQDNQDIAEHSEEIEGELKARFDEIERKAQVYHKKKEKAELERTRNPVKFEERSKGQGTLD